jgi:hypothetical protein
MAGKVGAALLQELPVSGSLVHELMRPYLKALFRRDVLNLAQELRHKADATVLRGLLALEEGDIAEAEVAFRVALALWKDQAAAASGSGLDFGGRPIAQGYLELLKE